VEGTFLQRKFLWRNHKERLLNNEASFKRAFIYETTTPKSNCNQKLHTAVPKLSGLEAFPEIIL